MSNAKIPGIASLGTPFPTTQAADDDKKFVPLWKQEARDEKGSKRFHGAFTGGFSAGYFNTVGSKEGWTPSSFVSSRKTAPAAKQDQMIKQNIADFMDNEDLEMLTDQDQIKVTLAYAKQAPKSRSNANLLEQFASDPLNQLISPRDERLGIKLLRQIGWSGVAIPKGIGAQLIDHYQSWSKSFNALAKLSSTSNATGGIGLGILEDEEEIDAYATPDAKKDYDQSLDIMTKSQDALSISTTLPAFVPANQAIFIEMIFPPPEVPADYSPIGLSNIQSNKHDRSSLGQSFALADGRKEILLSHPQSSLPKKPKLKTLAEESMEEEVVLTAPQTALLDPEKAKQALKGFMPFLANPLKHQRYVQFLEYHAGLTNTLLEKAPEMSTSEFVREQEEFLKLATMFKPPSTVIASRFVSSTITHIYQQPELKAGLSIPALVAKSIVDPSTASNPSRNEPEGSLSIPLETNATRKKSFGKHTRQEYTWIPSKLLCKRFGVPDPFPNAVEENNPKAASSKGDVCSIDLFKPAVAAKEPANLEKTIEEPSIIDSSLVRPPADLFKAIFGSQAAPTPTAKPRLTATEPLLNLLPNAHHQASGIDRESQPTSSIPSDATDNFQKKRPKASDLW